MEVSGSQEYAYNKSSKSKKVLGSLRPLYRYLTGQLCMLFRFKQVRGIFNKFAYRIFKKLNSVSMATKFTIQMG